MRERERGRGRAHLFFFSLDVSSRQKTHSFFLVFFPHKKTTGAPLARSAVDVVLCGRSDRSASRFFDGRVAQLALFDEALSPAAVEALWKSAGGKTSGPPRAGTSASSGVAAEAMML